MNRATAIAPHEKQIKWLSFVKGLADLLPGASDKMAPSKIARVPRILFLLDEPFGALDTKVRKELRSWLPRLGYPTKPAITCRHTSGSAGWGFHESE